MSVKVPVDFGSVISTEDVNAAVIKTLQKWLPDYLGRIEVKYELENGTYTRPANGNYLTAIEDDESMDKRLPAIIVTAAKTAARPTVMAGGNYDAGWEAAVSALVRGSTVANTRLVAARYEAAIRWCLSQMTDLGGFSDDIRWDSTLVAPVKGQSGKGRYVAAGMGTYTIFTSDAVTKGVGPNTPDDEPGGDYIGLAGVAGFDFDITTTPQGGSPE